MKTISTVVTAIAFTLTGCAHTGYYQQGSYGYGSGYGGYTTVDRYYQTSPSYYYQPGGVYGYEYYATPGYGTHHRDHDRDNDRRDQWRSGGYSQDRHRGSNFSGNFDDGSRYRWNGDARNRQDNFDRAVDQANRHHHGNGMGGGGDNATNWRQDNPQPHSRNFGEAASGMHHGGDMSGGRNDGGAQPGQHRGGGHHHGSRE